MSKLTFELNVTHKRMLRKVEAAEHCGRSVRRFEVECAVRPVRFPNGDLRWDVRDLDAWIDSLKNDAIEPDDDSLIDRLEAR